MGPRARRSVLYVGVPAAVALVATACFPARQPPPPPPPPSSTCSAASVPSQQHPVTYTAVVKDSSGRPNAHAFTATSEADKDAKTASLEQQGQVTSVQPTQVLKSLDTLTTGDLTDDLLFNRRTTSNDGHTTVMMTSISAADGNFAQTDVGAVITDTLGDLASGTRIASVSSPTAATISQPAIGSHTNDVFTITGQRSTTSDGQTSASTSITAPDGAFTSQDVGAAITDSLGDIPPGTTISGVSTPVAPATSSPSATISTPATGTHVNDVFTITSQPLHEQWSLAAYPGANFSAAWTVKAGQGMRIALVDTGVRLTHESFAGQVVAGPDYSNGGNSTVTGDLNGHGTHTAGIAGARDIDSSANASIDGAPGAGNTLGGSPNSTLLAVRALDQNGNGFDSDVANGITWAATPQNQSFMGRPGGGADVISLSLGGPCPDPALLTALQTARSNGVVVVAAAGNDSSCSAVEYPGAYSADGSTSVIAVASTDSDGHRSSFSNCGSYVNIAAPGGSILSTYNGSNTDYKTLSGTSMATPLVAAAAALVKEECPSFFAVAGGSGPDHVKTELDSHGTPVDSFSFHHLDAGAALAANCT